MKIYNDLSSNKILFGIRKNNNSKSINFGAGNFKTVLKTSHFIDNSLSASLDLPTQDIVESIYKNLKGLKKYFERTNFQKSFEMRSKYPFVESKPLLRGGYSFSLFEGDEKGKTLSVVRSKNATDIIRLVITENGDINNSTHFLVKGLDKVVANLNQKYPYMTPAKLRFMTAKELTDSNVVKYITLAEKELDKYYKFLQEGTLTEPAVASSKQTEENTPKRKVNEQRIMRVNKTQSEMTDKIFNIFENNADSLPAHISPKVSPTSGKVLVMTLPTDDGGKLRISKTLNPEYGDKLRYISIAKTLPDGSQKFLAIDTFSKKFLRTDSKTGKPLIPDGELLFYSAQDVERANLKEFFEDIYSQIFKETTEAEPAQAPEVAVLKIKEPVKVIDLDDTDSDAIDFEDPNLNKILDKTEAANTDSALTVKVPKKRGRKPKALTQNQEQAKEITTPKRRGRKPKVKTENPISVEKVQASKNQAENIDLDKVTNIEAIKQQVIKKAEEDAKILSDLYMSTLIENLKNNIQNAFNGAMEKLADLFKA